MNLGKKICCIHKDCCYALKPETKIFPVKFLLTTTKLFCDCENSAESIADLIRGGLLNLSPSGNPAI